MPIAVVCSCGANLKAPDATAGKRVKCPKCGSPIAVPAPEFEYEEVTDDPPPVAKLAKKKPQLVEEDEDDAPRPAKKAKAAPVEVDEAADDEEEEEEAPKKKRKGKRGMGKNREEEKRKRTVRLILGVCGAVTALGVMVGVVVAVMSVINNDPAKAGLATLPTQPAKPALPPGWTTFQGDGFSVGVPADLGFAIQPSPPKPPGAVVTAENKVYSGNAVPKAGGPPLIYAVSKTPVPAEEMAKFNQNKEAMWEQVRAQAKATANSKLRDEKTIQVGGVEGRQFTVEQGIVSGVVRVVLKDGQMYTWGVLRPDTAPAEDDPAVKPFLGSFAFN